MKKLILIALTVVMILTTAVFLCSCGETTECEYCDREYKKSQSQTKVYDGDTYVVCRDCADLFQDYEDGDAIECPYCHDLVRKKDTQTITMWGETDYMCDKCYEELKEAFE